MEPDLAVVTLARSEREVAADAVWSLFHLGVLQLTPRRIAEAANAAGLRVPDVERAKERRDAKWYRPPRDTLCVDPEPPPVAPEAAETAPEAAETPVRRERCRSPKERAKNPTDTLRLCQGPCHGDEGLLLEHEHFHVRDARTGSLDTICRECRKQIARARYLSVHKLNQLNAVGLTFPLTADDDVDGLTCLKCGDGFEVGQVVVANACLEHKECPDGTLGRS